MLCKFILQSHTLSFIFYFNYFHFDYRVLLYSVCFLLFFVVFFILLRFIAAISTLIGFQLKICYVVVYFQFEKRAIFYLSLKIVNYILNMRKLIALDCIGLVAAAVNDHLVVSEMRKFLFDHDGCLFVTFHSTKRQK